MPKPPRSLVWAWIGLVLLLALTLGMAFVPLGRANIVVALAVAGAKAVIVLLVFMELTRGHSLKLVFAGDARHQLKTAREFIEREFGRAPIGLWPSEGSVSDEALSIAAEVGFEWAATDVGLLPKNLFSARLSTWVQHKKAGRNDTFVRVLRALWARMDEGGQAEHDGGRERADGEGGSQDLRRSRRAAAGELADRPTALHRDLAQAPVGVGGPGIADDKE